MNECSFIRDKPSQGSLGSFSFMHNVPFAYHFQEESMKVFGLLLSLALSLSLSANTGVAFVHGTGKQTNALNDYWTSAMVNSVRQGLPNQNNYVVINCDFDQFMWDARAAGCLADQLYGFITSKNITDLVVITHSNGGNVIRWIMSNPTYDSR